MKENRVQSTEVPQHGLMSPLGTEKVHPWIRLFARITDFWIGGLVIGVIHSIFIATVKHGIMVTPLSDVKIIPFSLVFLIVVEAILLSAWGTTPGKWLFKMTLRNQTGGKLTFSTALRRSFTVWLSGLGFWLPIVSPITVIFSYYSLSKKGVTGWDRGCGCVVSHKKINWLGVMLSGWILLYSFSLLLGVAASQLGTRNYIGEQLEKIAVYLDENPILTSEITEGPYKGEHRVLWGGNMIRAAFSMYHPVHIATIFLPYFSGGFRIAGILVFPLK